MFQSPTDREKTAPRHSDKKNIENCEKVCDGKGTKRNFKKTTKDGKIKRNKKTLPLPIAMSVMIAVVRAEPGRCIPLFPLCRYTHFVFSHFCEALISKHSDDMQI